jgi:hypothetical protein
MSTTSKTGPSDGLFAAVGNVMSPNRIHLEIISGSRQGQPFGGQIKEDRQIIVAAVVLSRCRFSAIVNSVNFKPSASRRDD